MQLLQHLQLYATLWVQTSASVLNVLVDIQQDVLQSWLYAKNHLQGLTHPSVFFCKLVEISIVSVKTLLLNIFIFQCLNKHKPHISSSRGKEKFPHQIQLMTFRLPHLNSLTKLSDMGHIWAWYGMIYGMIYDLWYMDFIWFSYKTLPTISNPYNV